MDHKTQFAKSAETLVSYIGTFLIFCSLCYLPPALHSQATTQTAAERDIATLRAEWIRTLESKQLDAAMTLYARDASLYSPESSRTDGLPAIRALLRQS